MLDIRDIHVSYGMIEALKGIDLKVEEGQIVSLIGSNGAGKTTTLKTISGLLRPTTGEILFEGKPLQKMSTIQIVRNGILQVPEGRHVFPKMTVYENLLMGAYSRTDRLQIIEDIEHMFEFFPILKERLNQDAATLSGGEQQMLAMARALMAKPRLLLLDEPSMGLAPIIIQQIFEIIQKIHKEEGTTVLLIEQNAKSALEISDYAYVLEVGRITAEGRGSELLDSEEVQKAYLGG
ncbi:ABC transporter ATP-binding protein [Aerococcus sanguinicola]|uniref:ABC transporter ATP-binding protein n=1 Tax=unclassified Aerococcus TaxID=2618060 RepID=UPI0008A53F73|nr:MULTISPECIES: ABC transporter ATP-binding protein [unclassified Aerococcus]MDK6233327.1 ABC transporter ATP-binding protein [Aerococcus sp. UMB10185]MDK6804955.1 ABC transporter ATP-binding protein [Aerococcus sp. UMB7834]MDK6855156.1 ABC transporter ATP-binding protein [Aerococcus sp. UMB7533]MDK8501930.1 ABC transporter ATP-binding protein [Aerococcus sp. UMB1112A]OFN04338.1 ABC transporter ATP-binding protein [Aerococcus sp. HMSC062A02]